MAEKSQIICTSIDSCHLVNTSLVKNILVPFDNSKHSIRAFGHALDLARKYNSSLIIITVTDEDQATQWLHDTPSREKTVGKSRNAEFKGIFKLLETQAAKFQIHLETMILESHTVAESIIALATKKNIDYIVMGTHGNGMGKEMMLGRVSTNIALNAHCPVVLIK
jgi:nucleotide-binding universal stress UspA family protein